MMEIDRRLNVYHRLSLFESRKESIISNYSVLTKSRIVFMINMVII